MGDREPGVAASGFVAAGGGRWVAYVGPAAVADAVAIVCGEPCEAIVAAVAAAGGAAEVVNEALDAVADQRLADRFETVDHPVTGSVVQLRSPFLVDGVATTTTRRAPLFDEHTDEVLATLPGCTPERLADLRARRVIGGTLPSPADVGL